MAVTPLNNVVICVHNAGDPDPEEWLGFLRTIEELGVGKAGVLVHSAGGRPSALQRKQLADLVQGRKQMTAVLADSALVRTVVRLIAWFNPAVQAFAESDLSGALRYLGVAPEHDAAISQEFKTLQGRMRGSAHPAAQSGV